MPQTFGRYELGELLGRGGMGEVYRAHDTVRDRDVALKVLPQNLAADEWFTSRFRRESRLAAQLNEPHIIPIHDFGEIDGRLFIDMRLVEGQDLGSALRDTGPLPPSAAVDVIGQIAAALDAAHEHDLVHRDVKPSNVLLTGRTDDPYRPPFAYLVDFGIARSSQQQMTELTTTSSSTIGTVAYMAPERIAGRPGDRRVDVYALACVLYEALTGSKPFAGEVFAVMFAHVNTPPPRPSAVAPGVPASLDAVVARGMAKSENERFASAGELAAAARRALLDAGSPQVYSPPPPPPTGRPVLPPSAGPLSGPLPSGPLPSAPHAVWQPPPPPRAGRPRRTRRAALVTSAVLVLAAAVVGTVLVSGGSDDRPTVKPSGPLATVPYADVRDDGSLTWAIPAKVANFNPLQADGFKDTVTTVTGGLLPTPFRLDANGGATVDHDYFTDVTHTVTKDSAGLERQTVTYDINPKATWSDGSAITWQDLAAQWKALNGQNPNFVVGDSRGYGSIDTVTRGRDDRQAVVRFNDTYGEWQALFAPLLPRSLTATSGAFDSAWRSAPKITAGPFRWAGASSSGTRYTIRRDPKWWGERARTASIVFRVYADPAAAAKAVVAHTVDYADLTQGDEQANLRTVSGHDGVAVRTGRGGVFRQFTLNAKDPVLSDQYVRQAVLLGLDRAQLARSMLAGLTSGPRSLDNHVFSPNQQGYRATCAAFCTSDASRARALLERRGWTLSGQYYTKNGRPLTLTMTIPSNTATSQREAALAKTQLLASGIDLVVRTVPQARFFPDYVDKGDFQLTTLTLEHGQFPVNYNLLYPFYVPNDPDASFGYAGSDQIDQVLDAAAGSTQRADAISNADQGSALMWKQAAWVPLYAKPQLTAVSSDLVNIGPFGFGTPDWSAIGRAS